MCQRLNKRNFIKTMRSHPHRPKDNIYVPLCELKMFNYLFAF